MGVRHFRCLNLKDERDAIGFGDATFAKAVHDCIDSIFLRLEDDAIRSIYKEKRDGHAVIAEDELSPFFTNHL
jgi:hypothetical protein